MTHQPWDILVWKELDLSLDHFSVYCFFVLNGENALPLAQRPLLSCALISFQKAFMKHLLRARHNFRGWRHMGEPKWLLSGEEGGPRLTGWTSLSQSIAFSVVNGAGTDQRERSDL